MAWDSARISRNDSYWKTLVVSDRIQCRIERLLNEAVDRSDWSTVEHKALNVLAFAPDSDEAQAFRAAAELAHRLGLADNALTARRVAPVLSTQPVRALTADDLRPASESSRSP